MLGSRGMGAAKSTLMSLVGLGSVSSYCLHHMNAPVCVVHGKDPASAPQEGKKVLVAVDDSALARQAQAWAIDNVLKEGDQLHIVTVALPVPYTVSILGVGLSLGCCLGGGGRSKPPQQLSSLHSFFDQKGRRADAPGAHH